MESIKTDLKMGGRNRLACVETFLNDPSSCFIDQAPLIRTKGFDPDPVSDQGRIL